MNKEHLFIYHIIGHKVGCSTDPYRGEKQARKVGAKWEYLEIIEADSISMEQAGNIEWFYADKYNYPRGSHYAFSGLSPSDEAKAKTSQKIKDLWKDEAFRQTSLENRQAVLADPVLRHRFSELSKAKWEDPEYRAKVTVNSLEGLSRPEVVEKKAEVLRKRWSNPDNKSKQSLKLKEYFSNPENRTKRSVAVKKGKAKTKEQEVVE